LKYELTFNLARNSAYKTAKFPTAELKSAYIEAEARNLKCFDLKRELDGARTIEVRNKLAKQLDQVRFQFFQQWSKIHMPEYTPKCPELIVPDDVI
jgi:hypothetical protein